MARRPESGLVRVVPVPGLLFDPVETTAEEAAALVATGSFQHADPSSAPSEAVTADTDQEAPDGRAG